MVLGAAFLGACSSSHHADIDGVLIVDEKLTFERGEHADSAHLELPVEKDATFVAIVEEEGGDVKMRMAHESAPGAAAEAIQVDMNMYGAGVEVAAQDVLGGTPLKIVLESAQDFDSPGTTRLRVFRYDAKAASDFETKARLSAFRAWAAATSAQHDSGIAPQDAIRNIDLALGYFDSGDGDPLLAAWARLVRSRLNYRGMRDIKSALLDARRAAQEFAQLGAARNAGRARLLEVALLLDIALDRNARDPTAEEAARDARALLNDLRVDPSLSATEHAQVVNHSGVLAYNLYDWPAARAAFEAAIPAYEAIGNRWGRLQSLQNLAVLTSEEGDYQTSRQYFDRLLSSFNQTGTVEQRAALLYNASVANLNAGDTDRGIELLLRALELTRKNNLQQYEARILYGLGSAYSERGDTIQATTLQAAALKLRRKIDDPSGLFASLVASGVLARDAGHFAESIALHEEADSLAMTAEKRIYALDELARDYAAASMHGRAIATFRKGLALKGLDPGYYWIHVVQMDLAESLLAQSQLSPQAITEATSYSQNALNAAVSREDTTLELASRRVLAQAHLARGAPGEAGKEYRRAMATIFKYRSNLGGAGFRSASALEEQRVLSGYVDLLMRNAATRRPDKLVTASTAEEEALRVLEWARAINFDSARVSRLDAPTQARVDELLKEMAGKRVGVAALLERSDDVSRPLEILQLDIAQLRAQVDQLRAVSGRKANSAGASPLVDASWPALPEGVTQLSYMLDTQHAYLWVRDPSGIRTTVLAASPAAIARDLAALGADVRSRTPQRIDAALARLSSALIPPEAIAAASTMIQIVADGRINGIPFAGLSPPSRGGARMADRQSVMMIASLYATPALPYADPGRSLDLVALAGDARVSNDSPAAEVFSGLHSANAEVHAIDAIFHSRDPQSKTKLLLGAEGNASNLREYWREGADVVHFATHGLPDLRQPLTSLLLLPARDAEGNTAYLTAGQVLEWRGDIALVFLGACDTAVGPVRFAEGMSGIQGAFLRAGAHSVIATLWPVEDVYASQFAADFYGRYTQGVSAAQSLSETQRAWIKPSPGVRENEQAYRRLTAWAHVLYAP